jgi:hypothetical protein
MSFGKRGNLAGAVLALLATILALTGCGGGSTDATETTGSLARAEFVKKGNAICARTEKEVLEGVAKFLKKSNPLARKPPTGAQLEALAENVLVPKVRKQINEIRALGIPSGDEQEVEAIFAAAEAALKKTEEDPTEFAEGGSGPFVKANKLAREYGLTACGSEEGSGAGEEGSGAGE